MSEFEYNISAHRVRKVSHHGVDMTTDEIIQALRDQHKEIERLNQENKWLKGTHDAPELALRTFNLSLERAEENRALRETLSAAATTLKNIRECPSPDCPRCKYCFDAAGETLREIEEATAPTPAPEKREGRNDGE